MTLYTEAEAAIELRIDEKTLRYARYKHKITYRKYGKEVRYSQKDLDEYDSRCTKPARKDTCEADISSSNGPNPRSGRYTGQNIASLDAAQLGRQIARELK